jgi:hypothetical protein
MTRFFRFFSFAALTQLVLLLNQVILLPVQLRIWGTSTTAAWYTAIALATITTFADLGLRTAGHVELLRYVNRKDEVAGIHMRQVWGWIRVLVCTITGVLIGAAFVQSMLQGGGTEVIWKGALTLAYAIETLLIIRIVFLDSLGHYSGAEATYFVFALLRLSLTLPALLILKLPPQGIAWIFLATSVVGIALQGRLCKRIGILGLLDPLPSRLPIAVVVTARYTMAEPISNWLRISLPVLVIASISTPVVVATYVALRAVFGASRTTIQQLARVASVEYLRVAASGQTDRARDLLTGFVQFTGTLGVVIGSLVVVDNLRVLGLWLKHFERGTFQMIAACFALMFRTGELAAAARRQYSFVLYSAAFATIAALMRSFTLYLCLILSSEIILSTSFMLANRSAMGTDSRRAGQRGMISSVGGLIMLLILWRLVQSNYHGVFIGTSWGSAGGTAAIWGVGIGALAIFQALLNIDLINPLAPVRVQRFFMAKPVKS